MTRGGTTAAIEKILLVEYYYRGRLVLAHYSPHHWYETDVYSITPSRYAHEVEVKIDRGDYRRELTDKRYKHQILSGAIERTSERVPRTFSFATPPDLIGPDEVPDYAGLIYVNKEAPWSEQVRVVKQAPVLDSEKLSQGQLMALLRRYAQTYVRSIDVRP